LVLVASGGRNEGKADISAKYAPTETGARVSGADEHEERPARSETASSEGPQTSNSQQRLAALRFRRSQRIRRRAEFQEVYKNGTRVSGRFYTLFIQPNRLAVGRLGVAATRKLGGAVIRNRAKRLVREVFRRSGIAPGFDVIVVPRRELLGTSFAILEAEYRATVARYLRRQG
jgi:ribonuclease P protein component